MNRERPECLTVKEALEQGYKYYTGEDFESCLPLEKAAENKNLSIWYLMEKEPTALTVEPCDIYEDLADNFAMNQEVADDDDKFHDLIVEAVDWGDIARKINAALSKHPVYFPTKIKLIPNGK